MEEGREREEDFIMLPTVDFCFKELMKNSKVREGFIAALLGKAPEEVEGTEIMPGELPRDFENEKLGILDVLVRFRDGGRINLEMQVLAFACWRERVLFYLSKIYAGQLRKGQPYGNLQKCIHVSILNFEQFPEDKTYVRTFHLREDGSDKLYSDKLEIIVLELTKLPPEGQAESGVMKWLRFFSGKRKEDFMRMAETDSYIEEAYRELERLSADESRRWEYEVREKALRDYISLMEEANERGLEQGLERGLEQGLERGLRQGIEQGIEQGLRQGMDQGMAEGREKVNKLNRLLLKEKRYEELARSAEEGEYQKDLFKKYHI